VFHGELMNRQLSPLAKRLAQFVAITAVSAILLLIATAHFSPSVSWRMRLLREKLSGQIPEIPLLQLLKWMRPGSPVNLHHLAFVPDANASVTNVGLDGESPKDREAAAIAGGRTFGRSCSQCHGDDARGRNGPDLVATIRTMNDWAFFSTVKWGRPKTMMVAQPLSELEIWQVCAFLRESALNTTLGKKDTGLATALPSYPSVSPQMLLSTSQTDNWLTYAGTYAGYRYAEGNEITRQNVERLRLAWAAQLPSDGSFQESSPIVVGGRMFVTEPPDGVTALDAKTGEVLWQFHRSLPSDIPPPCCGSPNKGVAILGENVYVTTFDSHLVALDAATGAKVWDTEVADYHQGYSMTAAPLAINDRIVVGIAGADLGVRGFLAAYSASDGRQLWRFYTVPGPGEPGNETWPGGDTWRHGGGSTWVTGSYDPVLGLVYWGTGNPAPVFNSKKREGNNLYTCSVISLDLQTGQLRWYYQFTPADDHGWDATEQPVLADISWQGQTIPTLFLANRNGFFYALNRKTGQFLFAKPFAKQTWASGFTADGHPVVLPNSHPSRMGSVVSPASNGATNWWPPSFDPKRHLLYVPSADTADDYVDIDTQDYKTGRLFLGSGFERAHNEPTTLAVRAIDVSNGQLRWDSTLEKGAADVAGEMGGVLSTGGSLVFAGHSDEFDALDSDTGAKLWDVNLGGTVHAAPISYTTAGQQYIAVFAGRTLFVFGLRP
jgi:alcohol dehydrogenase (cytochrome c)